jgi:hypothetical protein
MYNWTGGMTVAAVGREKGWKEGIFGSTDKMECGSVLMAIACVIPPVQLYMLDLETQIAKLAQIRPRKCIAPLTIHNDL